MKAFNLKPSKPKKNNAKILTRHGFLTNKTAAAPASNKLIPSKYLWPKAKSVFRPVNSLDFRQYNLILII